MAEKMIQITVKVDPRIIARAEELRDVVTNETGLSATLADVYRIALIRGLQSLEREKARG